MENKIYDEAYAKKYREYSHTNLGKAIYAGRWRLIERYVKKGAVLDYGCGPGYFSDYAPAGFVVHNYDVNPSCGFTRLPSVPVSTLTLWDSMEHIPDYYSTIKNIDAEWVFITTPNLESVNTPVIFWKHYRPREHLYYFDRHSLSVVMEDMGYKLVEYNFDEGRLRDPNNPAAIITGVFKKIEKNS